MTRSGLQFVLDSVFEYTQLPIQYQNLHGTILGGIGADHVEYRSPNVTVVIDKFRTNFKLVPLVYNKLAFYAVNADEVKVILAGDSPQPVAQKDPISSTPKDNSKSNDGIPISFGVDNAALDKLIVISANQAVANVTNFKLHRSKISDRFDFANLQFDTSYASINTSGVLGFGEQADVKLEAQWKSRKIGDVAAMQGATEISGNYRRFKLQTSITSPHQIDIHAEINDLFNRPSWNASLKGKLVLAALFSTDNLPQVNQLSVSSSGNPDQFKLSATGQLSRADAGKWRFDVDALSRHQEWTVNHIVLALKNSSAKFKASGKINLSKADLKNASVDMQFEWSDLYWPISDQQQIEKLKGSASLQGSLQKYQLAVRDAALHYSGQDISGINLTGSGNEKSLNVSDFSCQFLTGRVGGNMELAWQEKLTGTANINASAINPGVFWADWPGKLSTRMSIKASQEGDAWQASVNVAKLSGRLSEIKIDNASSWIGLKPNEYTVRDLKISAGVNKASGRLHIAHSTGKDKGTIEAQWQLDLKNISKLIPNAAGSLTSGGDLSGSVAQPLVSMKFALHNGKYKQYLARRLTGTVSAKLTESGDINTTVTGDEIQIGGNRFHAISLRVAGKTQNHQLLFNSQLNKDAGTVNAAASGGYRDGKWQGRVTDVTVSTKKYGNWDLQEPAELQVAEKMLQLQTLCLKVKYHAGAVCSRVSAIFPNTWIGQATITQFPLSGVNAVMPANLRIASGMLNGEINYDINNGVINLLRAELNSSAGRVNYRQFGDIETLQDYKNLQLKIEHDKKGVFISNQIDLVNTGTMFLNLKLPGLNNISTVTASQPINGELTMDLNNLKLLSLVFPDIQHINGTKHTHFTIAGTINNPMITGTSRITAQDLSIPTLGIKLTDVVLQASSNIYHELTIDGQATSGKGKIKLTGSLQDYTADKLSAKLHITGENIRAVATPELTLDVSPDLTFALKNKKMTLEGEIQVPRANIQQLDTTSSLQPSSDLVLVDGEKPDESTSSDVQLTTAVRIKLGKDVKIQNQDALGRELVGRLEGELLVREQADGLSVASGEIRIVDGKYSVFNQELTIEKGKLIYSAVPVTQPTLDIEAVKKVGTDIRVGVRIYGVATAPQTQLISTPAMDDSSIMSYLVLGRPYDEASQQDKAQMAAGIPAMGLNKITKSLADELGIDEISVQVDQATQQNVLVVGQYFTKKFYMKYIKGASQALNALQLEYKLTDKWILRTETKEQSQGADLFYQIETN